MTCPTCAPWCATTEKQLTNRLRNMAASPEVAPHVCPQCSGTDWTISREMIRETPPLRWWQLPPSWEHLRIANGVAALSCLGLAVWSGPSLTGMVDTWLVGFNTAAMCHCTAQIRMRRVFDDLVETCRELHEVNGALVANKVVMHMTQSRDDDNPPIAPKLH